MTGGLTPTVQGDAGQLDTFFSTAGYSERTKLATNFFFGHDNATRYVIYRRHGWKGIVTIETTFLKKHQETHFVDGATKLGIMDEPHHILCAKYHTLSNLLGGVDMGYGYDEKNDRAYVCYLAPDCQSGGPFLPATSTWVLPLEIMVHAFIWQARNCEFLKDDRLYFCLTDHAQAGSPFNMGYWAFDDHALEPGERCRVELGSATIVPGPPPALPESWAPLARREAALEKYNGEYMIGGFAQCAIVLGEDEAIEIALRSHFTQVSQWIRPFLIRFGATGNTPAERFADLFGTIWGLVGDKFDVHSENGDIFLRNTKTRLHTPQYADIGWEYAPRRLEEAFARAWSVASRGVGPGIEVSVVKSRMDGDENTVWRFRQTNHMDFVGSPGDYDAVPAQARYAMEKYWWNNPVLDVTKGTMSTGLLEMAAG